LLRTRILSAMVLIPAVGAAVYLGGAWLTLVVCLAALSAGSEFYALLRRAGYLPATSIGLPFIALLLLTTYRSGWNLAQPLVTFALILSLTWQLFQVQSAAPVVDWALTLSGGVYLGWLMAHFLLLRAAPQGLRWLTLALLSTWVCDSAAYLVGVSIGKHKLWPRISPKKSWEGLLGGWVCGTAFTAALGALLGMGWLHGAVVGALIAIVGPFGDFGVSMLKRQVGVKDSSDALTGRNLIPGHGGMLDRIDSLLFTVPVVYYYARLLVR
jgi:phosphatidate cytidylyltransferase